MNDRHDFKMLQMLSVPDKNDNFLQKYDSIPPGTAVLRDALVRMSYPSLIQAFAVCRCTWAGAVKNAGAAGSRILANPHVPCIMQSSGDFFSWEVVRMDPLWLLVILIGFIAVVIAAGVLVTGIKVTQLARQAGPKLQEMQQQLTDLQAKLADVVETTEVSEEKFNQAATRVGTVSEKISRVVDVVSCVAGKARNINVQVTATMRAIRKVAGRTVKEMRDHAASTREVTLDD